MDVAVGLLALVVVVCAVSALGRRLKVSVPLLLVLAGVAGSYLPFIPPVVLIPDIVLIGILPPLLYAAALRTSVVEFQANKRSIGLLSVGYVILVPSPSVWWSGGCCPTSRCRPRLPSAPWSRHPTPWPPRPSPGGWACRGGS